MTHALPAKLLPYSAVDAAPVFFSRRLPAHPPLDVAAMNGEGLPPRNVPFALYAMMAGAFEKSDDNATIAGGRPPLLPRLTRVGRCCGVLAERERERDELVGSHGRWRGPCLQTAHTNICY
jgi:hypothetical protein